MDTFFSLFNKKTLLIGCAVIGATAAGAYFYTKWNEREGETAADPETRKARGLEILTGQGAEDIQGPDTAGNGSGSQTGKPGKKTDDKEEPKTQTFGGMKRGFLL